MQEWGILLDGPYLRLWQRSLWHPWHLAWCGWMYVKQFTVDAVFDSPTVQNSVRKQLHGP